jgi:hypothetical protein
MTLYVILALIGLFAIVDPKSFGLMIIGIVMLILKVSLTLLVFPYKPFVTIGACVKVLGLVALPLSFAYEYRHLAYPALRAASVMTIISIGYPT